MVCLILVPTLTSRRCSHTFWVLTSLHLFPFLLKMFFIILVVINYEDFASFATRWISTLTTISGHLKGIVSHKNIQFYS